MTMSGIGVPSPHRLRAPRLGSRRVLIGLALVQALGVGLWLPGLGRNAMTGLVVAFVLAMLWLWRTSSRLVSPVAAVAASRPSTKVVSAGLAAIVGLTCQPWVSVLVVLAVLAVLVVRCHCRPAPEAAFWYATQAL
jgi:hypothetical protein